MVFVVERQVVEQVFVLVDHAPQPLAHDDRNLVSECRVVGKAAGDRASDQQRMPVLVLQPLAVERRAAGGRAEQEAFRARVGSAPDGVADALEAEHRVEDVERDGLFAETGVGRAGRRKGAHRSRFGDALL